MNHLLSSGQVLFSWKNKKKDCHLLQFSLDLKVKNVSFSTVNGHVLIILQLWPLFMFFC